MAGLVQEVRVEEKKQGEQHESQENCTPLGRCARIPEPALNVVVYRHPGPEDSVIERHARTVVATQSPWGTGGGLGYLTLVESDFDRLWLGVDRGDVLGTAYAVLPFLGPGAEQFIGRDGDFIFGWVGGPDPHYGNVLLLQLIPRPHLLAAMN